MTEYISREKAIEAIKRIITNCNPDDFDLDDKEGYGWWMHSNGENLSVIKAELKIEKVPAADVVEVVRCKNCEYADEYNHCEKVACWMNADDFCSRGKRRRNDGTT